MTPRILTLANGRAWKVEVLAPWGSRQVSYWRLTCEHSELRQKWTAEAGETAEGAKPAHEDLTQGWNSQEAEGGSRRQERGKGPKRPMGGGDNCIAQHGLPSGGPWTLRKVSHPQFSQPFGFELIYIFLFFRYSNRGFQSSFSLFISASFPQSYDPLCHFN